MRKALSVGLVLLALAIAGCGGGSSVVGTSGTSSSGQPIASSGANVVTMTVDAGPTPQQQMAVDTPYITVTVCVPGTTQCQTFDHIEVDTGSYGLRILADATDTSGKPFSLQFQQETTNGAPVVECTQFVDGYSWGPVERAEVDIGGESASGVPIQVIGDPSYTNIPSACSGTGTQEDTVTSFGANGILGLGPFAHDCGSGCATDSNNGFYYICNTNPCQGTTLALTDQVTDPATDFMTDNNGVIIEMPSLGASGTAATISGSLVFGIGTEGNNTLKANSVLTADNYGYIQTQFKNQSLPYSYFDTGSNAYYFDDSSIPDSCLSNGNWFCPSSPLQLSATNFSQNSNVQSKVTFTIANASAMFNQYPTNAAFNNIGASAGNESAFCPNGANNCSFDFGLPFFFGRDVYIAFSGSVTSGGTGPYFAY